MYQIENYQGNKRFNEQYQEIYQFLLKAADKGYNEHFHWARFEWMMGHSLLDEEKLTAIRLFRNHTKELVGLITYDTEYEDRTYVIHSVPDKTLLRAMVEDVIRNDTKPCIRANSKDICLGEVLRECSFTKGERSECVLEFDLKKNTQYKVPQGYAISREDFEIDNWKYQLVIHKGFDNDDVPEKWSDDLLKPSPNCSGRLKVFALKSDEYCAHCGIWYTKGDTAYIEPVVTIPRCRNIGLAKAVVYEALGRARRAGAGRAIVLSTQKFYYKIGFENSSEYYSWT
jgi:GNAT superfamily N-acetyltransferase